MSFFFQDVWQEHEHIFVVDKLISTTVSWAIFCLFLEPGTQMTCLLLRTHFDDVSLIKSRLTSLQNGTREMSLFLNNVCIKSRLISFQKGDTRHVPFLPSCFRRATHGLCVSPQTHFDDRTACNGDDAGSMTLSKLNFTHFFEGKRMVSVCHGKT